MRGITSGNSCKVDMRLINDHVEENVHTELIPTPRLTPRLRKNHQAPAPRIPAAPVPLAKNDTPVEG